MKNNHLEVTGNSWTGYVSRFEDKPFFISFDVDCNNPEVRGLFNHEASILVTIKNPNQNGAPTGSEADLIRKMEDSLIDHIQKEKLQARLVARTACNGIREFLVEFTNQERFVATIDIWKKEFSDYQIRVRESCLGAWEIFDAVISPSKDEWLMIGDNKVIENLISAGSNPEKEHDIEYVFIGEPDDLNKIRDALKKRGYNKEVETNDEHRIEMSIPLPLDINSIVSESIANRELAREHNSLCDGWGAMIQK